MPPAVTDENLSELWQQHFEGKTVPVKKSQTKEPEKQAVQVAKDQNAGEPDGKAGNQAKRPKKDPQAATLSKVEQGTADKVPVANGTPDVNKNKKDKVKKSKVPKTDGEAVVATVVPPPAVPQLPTAAKLTPMQSAMRQKLISARFRHLNQTLYTAPSATSLSLFAENPEMFEDYHSGFRQQVSVWPQNPVDNFIATLRSRARAKLPTFRDHKKRNFKAAPEETEATKVAPLVRTHGTCTIADLGCGDARLSSTLHADSFAQKNNLKILSYDLQAPNKYVTKADVANLPLADGTVDMAIFCLALMGTNWIDFIEEAYRILHWRGELWIAEIKSRFGRVGGNKKGGVVEHSVGSKRKAAANAKKSESVQKAKNEADEDQALQVEVDGVETGKEETDVGDFVKVLAKRGFVLKNESSVDLSNRMFVKMEFVKAAEPSVGKNMKPEGTRKDNGGKIEEGTWKPKKKGPKFLDDDKDKEVPVEEEAKVLKPCLYKIR